MIDVAKLEALRAERLTLKAERAMIVARRARDADRQNEIEARLFAIGYEVDDTVYGRDNA